MEARQEPPEALAYFSCNELPGVKNIESLTGNFLFMLYSAEDPL
jgi:hypothetical protein